jgi:hypothetical protein
VQLNDRKPASLHSPLNFPQVRIRKDAHDPSGEAGVVRCPH